MAESAQIPPKRRAIQVQLFAYREFKDIRSRVVSGDVEIEFPFHDLAEVELGGEDALARIVRAGEDFAERVYDDTAAADDRFRIDADVLASGQHETAALIGDVAHGRYPGIAVVDGRRTVQLDALLVQVCLQQRHVILPADGRADPSDRQIVNLQGRSITESPDESL